MSLVMLVRWHRPHLIICLQLWERERFEDSRAPGAQIDLYASQEIECTFDFDLIWKKKKNNSSLGRELRNYRRACSKIQNVNERSIYTQLTRIRIMYVFSHSAPRGWINGIGSRRRPGHRSFSRRRRSLIHSLPKSANNVWKLVQKQKVTMSFSPLIVYIYIYI